MNKPLKVLIVEDSEDDALLVIRELRHGGYAPDFEIVETAEAMRSALGNRTWDLVISDYSLPAFNALAALNLVIESGLDLPFIVVSGTIGEETAVAAMRAGAHDYLMKGNLARLSAAVERELSEAGLRREYSKVEEALRESEKRLIEAQHIANMGDFTWDVETDEVTWSDGLFDLLQYDKSEKIDYARVNEEIHHPDDLKRVTQWLNDCIASGKAELAPNEYRLIRKDGKILYVNTVGVIARQEGQSTKVFATLQDITERKQMEGEIRESEEKFRVLYNNSPDMTASVSPHDASILQCNETLLNKTGYSREEVIGSPIFKIYHNDCMAEVKKAFQEFVETGVIKDRELILKRKDGSKFDVSLNVNAIRGQAGEIKYSVSSWRDITERKQAELELIKAKHKAEEGEKRFRAFIEQSPVAIALYNLDGTGIYANQKYLDVLGLQSLGDFIGRPAHEYFAPQFREESKERSRRRLLRLPVPVEFESIALHSDGSEFPMQVAVGAIKLSAGETVNISFIANISDRRQAEEALRESEATHKKMIANISDVIGIMGVNGVMKYKSTNIEKYFGWKPEDIIGTNGWDTVHPDDLERIQKEFVSILGADNLSKTVEYRYKCKDESYKWIKLTAINLVNDPLINGVLLNYRDITERKQEEEEKNKLEAQLQQAQKMEAIGALAGGIAHDFNNVLYAVMGYTELTMDLVTEGSTAQTNLQRVMKAADRAKEMVQQILAFSRQSKKEKKPISVQSVLKEAGNLLRTSIPSTIEIRQDIDTECDAVMADPTQIHQIIMNLATNAYHAMQETGGVLGLTLMQDEIGSDDSGVSPDLKPGAYLKLTVEDTGHGIDRDVMGKIFDPYFTTKAVGKGTGMGLSVVYGIVKEHGGDIRVYSEPGQGTAFHVYLPVIETDAAEPNAIFVEPAPTGTERILFVDDEEALVDLARRMLETLGYHVTTHTGSVAALEAFRGHPDEFDLVITDMTMPKMTGAELAPRLLEIRPDIPIILCTGFSDLIDEGRAGTIGIRAYLAKPILKNEMAKVIRKMLGKPNAD